MNFIVNGGNIGACIGAAAAFGLVYLRAQDLIAWQWLLLGSPLVIVGYVVGAAIHYSIIGRRQR